MLDVVTSDAKRLDRRGNITVVDLGGPDLLGVLPSAFFRGVPAIGALEDSDLSQHAQGIDPAARAAACGPDVDLARPRIGHPLFDRHIDANDFRNQATRELCAQASTRAGQMPGS